MDTKKIEGKKILNKTISYLDYKSLWKTYYGARNLVYILKSNNISIRTITILCIGQAILIMFFLDHKILRLKIFKDSVIDGYKGNLGIKYTPDNFLKKI